MAGTKKYVKSRQCKQCINCKRGESNWLKHSWTSTSKTIPSAFPASQSGAGLFRHSKPNPLIPVPDWGESNMGIFFMPVPGWQNARQSGIPDLKSREHAAGFWIQIRIKWLIWVAGSGSAFKMRVRLQVCKLHLNFANFLKNICKLSFWHFVSWKRNIEKEANTWAD
jgi:hypothetical protein